MSELVFNYGNRDWREVCRNVGCTCGGPVAKCTCHVKARNQSPDDDDEDEDEDELDWPTERIENFSLKGEPMNNSVISPDPVTNVLNPDEVLPTRAEPSLVFNYNRADARVPADKIPLGIPSLTKMMANEARAEAQEAKVRKAVHNLARGKAVGSFADAQGDASEILRAGRAAHGGVLPSEMQEYWLPTRKFAGSDTAQKLLDYMQEVEEENRKRLKLGSAEERDEDGGILPLPSMEKFISEDRKSRTALIERD